MQLIILIRLVCLILTGRFSMNNTSASLTKRICFMLVGNLLLGLSVAMLRLTSFGTDPFNAMNLGVSLHLPISYASYQMLFNIALFIPIFLLDRRSFGVGALVNMLFLGYFVEFFLLIFSGFGITTEGMYGSLPARILLMIAAIVLLCFSCGLYMECDLGAAPWDRLAMVIENLSHGRIPFRYARMTYDILAILVAYFTGATIGVATLVVGFFTGPLVSFFRTEIIRKYIL